MDTRKALKGKWILVVDDEEDILELLRFNLSNEGFQVSCAASGEEALEKVKTEVPALILLDLQGNLDQKNIF